MIKPVSLDELCKDGKPTIYIAALRVDEDFYPDDARLLIPEPRSF